MTAPISKKKQQKRRGGLGGVAKGRGLRIFDLSFIVKGFGREMGEMFSGMYQ